MSRLARLLGASDQRLLAVEHRLHEQAERLDHLRSELEQQRERLVRQRETLDRQRTRLDEQAAAHRELGTDLTKLTAVYPILEQQLASFETRLQQLAEQAATGDVESTDAERAAAVSLLDEVRREHSRIRVRFGVVTRYEERLRRLEEALRPTPDQKPAD